MADKRSEFGGGSGPLDSTERPEYQKMIMQYSIDSAPKIVDGVQAGSDELSESHLIAETPRLSGE